jgi:hypothetical protein
MPPPPPHCKIVEPPSEVLGESDVGIPPTPPAPPPPPALPHGVLVAELPMFPTTKDDNPVGYDVISHLVPPPFATFVV